ncbi:MAG: hypothetical protein NUV31_10980 [Dehalococcoidales bacterium]|jgi:hypothetical protein|nr:hypothetical protein [Dehalococcoidales bacterium]
MAEFLQSYGILILSGVILVALFVWLSRRRLHQGHPHQTDARSHEENGHRHGGCC